MWQFAILEIYSGITKDENGDPVMDNEFPQEGTPADWIEKGTVNYCDGRLGDLVALTPWHMLARYKLRHWLELVYLHVTWRLSFDKCMDCGKRELILGVPVGDHDSCNPFGLGDDYA